MDGVMTALVSFVAAVLAVCGFIFFASRRGNRTWTDEEFEHDRESGTALGNAFLATQAILDGGASQPALEQRTVERADTNESGAPPDPGADEAD